MTRRMSKNIAVGMVVGISIGLALYVIFPNLLNFEVSYKAAQREALGFPGNSYSVTSGSPLMATFLIPLAISIFEGLRGWLYTLISSPKK